MSVASKRVNRRLALLLAALLGIPAPLLVATPAAAVTTPVLVAHWNFDESVAGTNANDSIGTNDGVPGTQTATYPTPSATVPPVSFTDTGSMDFNGDNYFEINNPVSTDFTICAWVKTTSVGGGPNHWESAPIMDAEWGGVADDFGFGISDNGTLVFGNGGTPPGGGGLFDAQVDGATSINDNVWHNVCATRDNTSGSVKLFVDANQDGSGSTGVSSLTIRSTARIGWGYDGAALYQGLIDDVRVYDGVLTTAQLQSLASGLGNIAPPVVVINDPTASSIRNSWTPSVNWGTADVCAYSWDTTTWTTVNCANNGTDISAPANGSARTLSVRANMNGDTHYGTASATFTYDTIAPVVDAGVNQQVATTFSLGSAAATDSGSGLANTTWSKVGGPGSITFSNVHALHPTVSSMSQDGTYVLRLTATDNAGNATSDDVTIIWDATKPTVGWTAGGFPDSSTNQTSTIFRFNASDVLSEPVAYKCKLDTGAFVSCTSPTSVDTLAQGSHTFTVRATDAVGNAADDLVYSWSVVADQGNDQNGDGVVDAVQKNVMSFASDITEKTVALEVDSTCEVKQAGINAESREAVADPGYDYPNGLLDFAVDCGASGFTATVTQYYYDVAPSQLSLRKYNPTSKTYSTVHAATITTKNVYGRTVTTVGYEVTDGGELDQDGVENGVIVDPAGLAVPVARPATAADLAATGGPYALLLGVGSILLVTGVVLRTTARRRSF